jgi:C-terminal processing protease CtpA/Prc
VAALADVLWQRVVSHYGAGRRTEALRETLRRFDQDPRPVEVETLAEVQEAAQQVFRHLELTLSAGLTPEEHSAGWPEVDVHDVRRQGAFVRQVARHPGGAAVLQLDGLATAAAAAPILAGAFALTRGASGLVLDLRGNGGGDPATLALVVDWLAGGPPRHLFDVHYQDRTHQWWTAGASLAEPPGCPVVALIGPSTYSSGEALAWVLQHQGLARLVGQPTRGAADHVVPLALTTDVQALLPEATVVGPQGEPTWEGSGVQPDQLLDLDPGEPLGEDVVSALLTTRHG